MSNTTFDYNETYPMMLPTNMLPNPAAASLDDMYANTSFSGAMYDHTSAIGMQMPFMSPPSPLSSSANSPHSARSMSPSVPSPADTPSPADRAIQPRSARLAAKSSASALKYEIDDALVSAPTDRKRKASKAKGAKPGKRARAADPSDDSDSECFNLEALQGKNLSPEVISALLEENDLKKQRLARKAALARESRQKKKSRMEQLEDEVAHLRELLAQAHAHNGTTIPARPAYSLPTIGVDMSPSMIPHTGSSSPRTSLSTVSSSASLAGSYSTSSASMTPKSSFSPASSSHFFSHGGHLAPIAVAQGPMDHYTPATSPVSNGQSLASFVLSSSVPAPAAVSAPSSPTYATEASVQDLKDTLQGFMGMVMQMMHTNANQRPQ